MPCLNTLNGVLRKKRLLEQKTSKSSTVCSCHWSRSPDFQQVACPLSTKSWYTKQLSVPSCASSKTLQSDIAQDSCYIANIGGMRLQLPELQKSGKEAKLLRGFACLPKGWEDVKGVLWYQELPYVPEIIRSEVINCHHNDFLAGHFGINKTKELVGWKYYWPSLRRDVKSYAQGCKVCLTSKAVCHKPYKDLQSLPVLTHQ